MTADPQLRDRLERAARFVNVDPPRQLERVHGVAARRGRGRRVRAMAAAAAIGLVAAVLVWQLRPSDERDLTPAGIPVSGRIAYLGDQGVVRGLFALDVVNAGVAEISEGLPVLKAEWSPDGTRIAYIQQEPGPRYSIVVADADGRFAEKIVEEEDTGAAGPDLIDLSWSPDGSELAYSGRVVEDGVARRTILIVNVDGAGDPQVLEGLWTSVDWSPDGERLLLVGFPQMDADGSGRFDLYTVRPDGSDLQQLTDDEVVEYEPSWSPDGTRIVLAKGGGDYDQDIYLMNVDGSGVRRITDWQGLDLFPVWSPDGAWIAFASDRDATQAELASDRSGEEIFTGLSLYVMRIDGSDVSPLLEGDGVLPVSWTA